MTKIVGLTGGIGSGKSTIAAYLRSKGIPVYIADEAAKKLMYSPKILKKIKLAFGETIFEDELLNKEKLAQIVFNDVNKLKVLNAIIHPAVKADFKKWLKVHHEEPLVVKEAAILFESGTNKDCDAVITVVAPLDLRIARVVARDKCSKMQIMKRIKNQWTDEMRLAKSDYSIDNNDLKNAFEQVDDILKKIAIH
jgi:dephospho-CoA kinase